jgi:uncharacterized membrane protein YqhA
MGEIFFIIINSLLVIGEVTLYFDESQTELAVGFTLTIMLVMYTLYQSINESMTKTAYLKMIDYWLLFCLLVPFTIFMIEIFWLLNKSTDDKEKEKSWIAQKDKKLLGRKLIRILVPSLTVIFILTYLTTAVVVFNSSC